MRIQELGAFEAKTHLSRLLDAVEKGEKIFITRRGKRVAQGIEVRPVLRPVYPRHAQQGRDQHRLQPRGLPVCAGLIFTDGFIFWLFSLWEMRMRKWLSRWPKWLWILARTGSRNCISRRASVLGEARWISALETGEKKMPAKRITLPLTPILNQLTKQLVELVVWI